MGKKNKIYRIANKSIDGKIVFYSNKDYERMKKAMRFFSYRGDLPKFSQFLESKAVEKEGLEKSLEERVEGKRVKIIAYLLTPSGFEFILKEMVEGGISDFISLLSNSYTRKFNIDHNRKGSLWEGKYKSVSVNNLKSATRYVHRIPVDLGLAEIPIEWKHSSYKEFVKPRGCDNPLTEGSKAVDMEPTEYRRFTNDRSGYLKDIKKIKRLIS